uniref:Crossover junction endonuclease MUS81 n=1 Tax=Angiostrongylus cantonensis TaxID=6313 RepID=A0A0K0DCD3_ANGCA
MVVNPRITRTYLAEAELRTREVFSERNIGNQFVCDEERTDMKVFWHRKCIEAVEEGGDIVKKEYHVQQHVFAVVLSNHSLKELVRSKSLEDFVAMQKLSYPVTNSSLLLIRHAIYMFQMHDLSIELFDNYRAQFHYAPTAHDFALYLAQITRALAKMGRTHDSTGQSKHKAIFIFLSLSVFRDWWSKMLSVICRMQDGQRRAILSAFPNPFIASQKFIEMGYTDAVRELANIETEDGRRLGPVMAHRLFMILTDSTGTEIIF